MTYAFVTIQITPESKPAMPFWMGEVAAFAQVLRHTGMLKTIQEQVRFARSRFGQYDLIDFVAVLIGETVDSIRPCVLASPLGRASSAQCPPSNAPAWPSRFMGSQPPLALFSLPPPNVTNHHRLCFLLQCHLTSPSLEWFWLVLGFPQLSF